MSNNEISEPIDTPIETLPASESHQEKVAIYRGAALDVAISCAPDAEELRRSVRGKDLIRPNRSAPLPD